MVRDRRAVGGPEDERPMMSLRRGARGIGWTLGLTGTAIAPLAVEDRRPVDVASVVEEAPRPSAADSVATVDPSWALFRPDRTPGGTPYAIWLAQMESTADEPAPEPPGWVLVGVVRHRVPLAIVEERSTGRTELVQRGMVFDGFTVRDIAVDSILVQQGAMTWTLKMSVPGS